MEPKNEINRKIGLRCKPNGNIEHVSESFTVPIYYTSDFRYSTKLQKTYLSRSSYELRPSLNITGCSNMSWVELIGNLRVLLDLYDPVKAKVNLS